jgi:hypothetical protein
MRYQNPQLFYFLFAIAIPILIHLFNFRKHKTIYFSSIRFLKEIKEENKKKSNLKNILILLSRILAIAFLVLAFAKPYIPLNNQKKTENIFIYIDNSLSMDADFGEGNLIEIAKEKARTIIKSYPAESDFYLIVNDFEVKHNSNNTAEVILDYIDVITPSAISKSINQIIGKQQSIIKQNSHLYYISDLQENTTLLSNLNNIDSSTQLFIIPVKNKKVSNICIDSCYINSPMFTSNNEIELHVVVSNKGIENITDEVVFLNINQQQKSQQYITLLTDEKKTITFNFSTNNTKIISGEIRTNDSPISFDNSLFFSFSKTAKVNVYCINQSEENKAIKTLFNTDTSLFNFSSTQINNINFNTLKNQDLIIINEVEQISSGLISSMITFAKNGGSIAIIPPFNKALVSYNISLSSLGLNTLSEKESSLFGLKISNLNLEHPLFNNVFKSKEKHLNYPTVKQFYSMEKNYKRTRILSLENNKDFLVSFSKGKGVIYQFASPLQSEFTTLTSHALFVPIFINIATSSIKVNSLYNILGKTNNFRSNYTNSSNNLPHLTTTNIDIIPTLRTINSEQLYNTNNQIKTNGIYELKYENKLVDKIAFNYNSLESENKPLSTNQIEEYFTRNSIANASIIDSNTATLSSKIKEQQNGKEFWKIALLLSLLFFAIEILLIKLIKL